jgi:hypothetical protein
MSAVPKDRQRVDSRSRTRQDNLQEGMGHINARRLVLAIVVSLCSLAAAMAPALAGAAQAGECPNEALRAEANSTQLAECRAYELVSPVDTADSAVAQEPGGNGAAPDGEAATFISDGAFAGAGSDFGPSWYIARRVENAGWETSWVGVSGLPGSAGGTTLSFDLSKALVSLRVYQGEGAGSQETPSLFLSEDLAEAPPFSFESLAGYLQLPLGQLGGRGEPEDETPAFSDVVVSDENKLTGRTKELYELSGVGGPAEALRLVGVGPHEEVIEARVGGAHVFHSQFHAISNDGAEVFFTDEESHISYVRVNESKTLALDGVFRGASEDGAKVFVSGEAGKLYLEEINSEPGHEAVSEKALITPGASATYLHSSDDGSYVYFLSTGVLAGNENGNTPSEKAQAGKPNLYVYDTLTKKTVFIAQAEPGAGPGGNISEGEVEAQVNGCPSGELGEAVEAGCEAGRFFVFTSTARLTPDDMGSAAQVFEYDARSGHLTRVSGGEGGYDHNGNDGLPASIAIPHFWPTTSENQTELFEDGSRAVSDDGSTVVFTTAGALSPRAINGQPDIYEWHEGQVSMISTGDSLTGDEHAEITPSGRDIFFLTNEGILPQDTDGLESLYDARVGGGFPAPLVGAGGCNGDSCQGPPSVPDLLGAGASATFTGLGNPTAPAPDLVEKQQVKVKPKQCKKGYIKRKKKCVREQKARKSVKADRGVRS